MFFDGGVRGFFDDLYYGAVEKGYKLTHPEIWDCVLKSQAEAIDDNGSEDIIDALQTAGVEDEELFDLLRQSDEMDSMSREEAEGLIRRLREKKVTVDFSRFTEELENELKPCRKKKRVSFSEGSEIPESNGTGCENQKTEDLVKILKIIGEKWNPYDTFPEEKKYYSFEEVMEMMQRLSNIVKD